MCNMCSVNKIKTKNLLYLLCLKVLRVDFCIDKAKLLTGNFSRSSNLNDLGISLPSSHSWTNPKLHNIPVMPRLDRKVITGLDLWKTSGPYCISVVVLKNCEFELSYILAELMNLFLKESCFPDCSKTSYVVPVFKNVNVTF